MEDFGKLFAKELTLKKPLTEGSPKYDWFISADKIFSCETEGFEDYAKIFGIEFCVSRFSLFDGAKSSDSAVAARDLKVYMSSGTHCAMIQGRLAKGIVVSKITIKKAASIGGKFQTLETKEFSQCVVQTFSIVGDVVSFSFRYSSYSDAYASFNEDGTSKGTAATKVDLAKWEVENS
ncbi:MAG: hypothetical protein LBL99_04360 [Holosporaceae bacterium]|nr:hypothetical protein [Holosporaceae bacterium]